MLLSLILVAAVANLNLSVANVALPSIGLAFDASQTQLDLVAVGYSLGLAASVLWLGALGDRHGRKLMLILGVALLYALVGAFHWLCRRPFLLISTDPDRALREGWHVRLWDLLFYLSFGVVVASSVRVGGVLLVFSYLIVPALAAVLLGGSLTTRLLVGWAFGTLVSVIFPTNGAGR